MNRHYDMTLCVRVCIQSLLMLTLQFSLRNSDSPNPVTHIVTQFDYTSYINIYTFFLTEILLMYKFLFLRNLVQRAIRLFLMQFFTFERRTLRTVTAGFHNVSLVEDL